MTPSDETPRSLRDVQERQRRRTLLTDGHMAPLAAYAARLRTRQRGEVQDFDPCDGGVAATILFLLEKPGPMTDPSRPGRAGSGFISRDNDDPTAEAVWRFMRQAGLARRSTIIWNAIPWWDGRIAFNAADRAAGLAELPNLLALLPRLHTAVLVGRTASRARGWLGGLRVLESAHPSPNTRAGNRALWDAIPGVWAQAAAPYQGTAAPK